MRAKTACLFTMMSIATGCDGENDLDGTWFFQTTENGMLAYVGEHTIVQEESRVTLRDCRGYRTYLTREGNSLFNIDGTEYYLRVVDSNTLAGPGDLGATSTAVKLFPATHFAHGLLHIDSAATGELKANDDVCAMRHQLRYSDRLMPTVTISAPYGEGAISVEMSFREISVGAHPVLEFADFVDGSGPGVHVTVEFLSPHGNDALPIVSGTIDVVDTRSASFEVFGTLQLAMGEVLSITSGVHLEMPQARR